MPKRPAPPGWETTGESYDPDRIFSMSSDKKGHSQPTSVRMMPEVMGALQRSINRRDYPYGSVSDFIRDAVYHRMHYWNERKELGVDPGWHVAIAIMEFTRLTSELEHRVELVDKIREGMERAIHTRDLSALDDIVEQARIASEQLHQPYAGQLAEIIGKAEAHEREIRQIRRL